MRTLYLHIGRNKTASTTIQYFVDANRDVLSSSGLAVPDIGYSHRQHFELALALHNRDAAGAQSLLRRFREFMSSVQTDVFISNESLSRMEKPNIEALATVAQRFRVIVLGYVRDYPSLIVSLYNHNTKKGRNQADFDSYYEINRDRLSFVPELSNFADVFGWENVRTRSLDPRCLTGGALELDLLAAVERTYLRESMTFSAKMENASWPWIKIELIRAAADALMRVPGLRIGKTLIRVVSPFVSHVDHCFPQSNAQYLTENQWGVLRGKYNEDIAFINLQQPKSASIPALDIETINERPFLPSLDALPLRHIKTLASRLGADHRSKTRFPEVYEAISSVLAARISQGHHGAQELLDRNGR